MIHSFVAGAVGICATREGRGAAGGAFQAEIRQRSHWNAGEEGEAGAVPSASKRTAGLMDGCRHDAASAGGDPSQSRLNVVTALWHSLCRI